MCVCPQERGRSLCVVVVVAVVCVGARRSIVFLLVAALPLAWRLLLDSRDGSLLIDPCSRPSVKGAQRLSPGLTLTRPSHSSPSASARFQDPPSQRNPFLLIFFFFFANSKRQILNGIARQRLCLPRAALNHILVCSSARRCVRVSVHGSPRGRRRGRKGPGEDESDGERRATNVPGST